MRKIITSVVFVFLLSAQVYSKPLEQNEWKQPYPEKAVHHSKYTSVLDCGMKTPMYVYYDLYSNYFSEKTAERKSWWPNNVPDDIKTVCGLDYAVTSNYNSSGYARGHFDPAANYSADLNSMKETFSFANAAPQNNSFNSGLWANIEKTERQLAVSNNGITVITGVIHKGSTNKINNNIDVPVYFYKIVLWENEKGKINYQAWLAANIKPDKNAKPVNYLTDINTIESMSGLNFIDLPPAK